MDTELYLVRIWKRSRVDGQVDGQVASSLRGKLQNVVSGAECYFDGLLGLPEALKKLIEQEAIPFPTNLVRQSDDSQEA